MSTSIDTGSGARFDAIVVGGGPAGTTAALLLARAGWRVALVEKAAFPRRKVCGEFISATTWPLLAAMGVSDALRARAGPPIRRVAVFAGTRDAEAPLPSNPRLQPSIPGRAIGREHLDAALLSVARSAGVHVWQPATLTAFAEMDDAVRCTVTVSQPAVARKRETDVDSGAVPSAAHGRTPSSSRAASTFLHAPVVVAAHGAWETGVLPTHASRHAARPHDLLAFKAHFRGAALPSDLMPLLAFPGGYGGLVSTDDGRTSLSCCVRRDALRALRAARGGGSPVTTAGPPQGAHSPGARSAEGSPVSAGDAVLAHITATCRGAADALGPARRDGAWLAAGPLRTGIRTFGEGRIVAVGNAAAEAHPIVAEGIAMAIQSAHLACAAMVVHRPGALDRVSLERVRDAYAKAWRANFARRIAFAACYAHLFMRPATAFLATRTLAALPSLLTLGAHWCGKDATLSLSGEDAALGSAD